MLFIFKIACQFHFENWFLNDENDKQIHNHETKDSEYGIHSCIKPYINRYMGYNIKTMEMINHLSKEGKDSVEQSFTDSKTPSYAQITNYDDELFVPCFWKESKIVFVIILLLLRELNIKLFYSNFILFKLTIFYNTL